MELSLKGKVSVVTGGARGIGKAIADVLAAAGSDVVLLDVLEEDLKAAEADLASKGVRALGVKANVTSFEEIEKVVDEIVEKFGKIDVLVNNAGITRDNLLIGMTEEEWDKVIAVNLKGTFNMIRVAGRQMLRKRSGSIVNIASLSGSVVDFPQPQASYNASKAGVIQLTRSLASEWADRGVRVNCVSPGFIATEMTKLGMASGWGDVWLSMIPMARLGEPSEVANAVWYLASDAASYATGTELQIDGGFSLR